MALKYIINNGQLRMGKVELHAELHGSQTDKSKTIGGGRFLWDKEANKVYFYDASFDFGSVTKKQFQEAWNNSLIFPAIADCEIYFTNHHSPVGGEENLILKEKN